VSAGEKKVMTDRRSALALLGLGSAGVVASALPAASQPTEDVRATEMKRFFPNVPLQTHDGRSVRFYDDLVKGRKVIINFTFTSCTATCPRTTSNLSRVQNLLGERVGRDIFIVSLSLDPTTDTPEVLKAYAKTYDARPGWTFATGRREDIDRVRRRLGLYDNADFTQHTGLLTFGNEPEGKWAATPALDKPENILYYVLRRVDPFKYEPWPAKGGK
jgi:protein SCO1